MDNSARERRELTAREMTEEIDQATSFEALQRNNEVGRDALERERAGSLGNRVLTYNPQLAQEQNTRVQEMVETENGLSETAMERPNLVGEESKVQVAERAAEDAEDVANELGLNGRYVEGLMKRNGERITNQTVEAVDKLIAENEARPGRLDQLANKARTAFLKDVFNRILGSRN